MLDRERPPPEAVRDRAPAGFSRRSIIAIKDRAEDAIERQARQKWQGHEAAIAGAEARQKRVKRQGLRGRG